MTNFEWPWYVLKPSFVMMQNTIRIIVKLKLPFFSNTLFGYWNQFTVLIFSLNSWINCISMIVRNISTINYRPFVILDQFEHKWNLDILWGVNSDWYTWLEYLQIWSVNQSIIHKLRRWSWFLFLKKISFFCYLIMHRNDAWIKNDQ